MAARRLTLKRDVLQELGTDDLAAIAAAGPVTTIEVRGLDDAAQTMYSCLHYISCAFLHTCYVPQTALCVQTKG